MDIFNIHFIYLVRINLTAIILGCIILSSAYTLGVSLTQPNNSLIPSAFAAAEFICPEKAGGFFLDPWDKGHKNSGNLQDSVSCSYGEYKQDWYGNSWYFVGSVGIAYQHTGPYEAMYHGSNDCTGELRKTGTAFWEISSAKYALEGHWTGERFQNAGKEVWDKVEQQSGLAIDCPDYTPEKIPFSFDIEVINASGGTWNSSSRTLTIDENPDINDELAIFFIRAKAIEGSETVTLSPQGTGNLVWVFYNESGTPTFNADFLIKTSQLPDGRYNFEIKGTSTSGVTETQSMTLVVTPAPEPFSYNIEASQKTIRVEQGKDAIIPFSVTTITGTSEQVTLSIGGYDFDIFLASQNLAFYQSYTGTPPIVGNITLEIDSETPPRTYYLEIQGRSITGVADIEFIDLIVSKATYTTLDQCQELISAGNYSEAITCVNGLDGISEEIKRFWNIYIYATSDDADRSKIIGQLFLQSEDPIELLESLKRVLGNTPFTPYELDSIFKATLWMSIVHGDAESFELMLLSLYLMDDGNQKAKNFEYLWELDGGLAFAAYVGYLQQFGSSLDDICGDSTISNQEAICETSKALDLWVEDERSKQNFTINPQGAVFMETGAKQVTASDSIGPGVTIKTEDGSVEIKTEGNQINVYQNTKLKVDVKSFGETIVELVEGKIKFTIAKVKLDYYKQFKVKMSDAVVSVRGTEFIVDHNSGTKISDIHIFDGVVGITPTGSSVEKEFGPKESVTVKNGIITTKVLTQSDWNTLIDGEPPLCGSNQELVNGQCKDKEEPPPADFLFKFNTMQSKFADKYSSQSVGEKPYGIATDSRGNIYTSTWHGHSIQKFDSSGNFLAEFSGLNLPLLIAIDSSDRIIVANAHGGNIVIMNTNGQIIDTITADFKTPSGVAVDNSDNIYVSDTENHRILKFDKNGTLLLTIDGPIFGSEWKFGRPIGVAADDDGNIYVADRLINRIVKFDSNGNFIKNFATSGLDQVRNPHGLLIDGNTLSVADYNNDRIIQFNTDGIYLGEFGSFGTVDGKFTNPTAIAKGSLVVADHNNHRIQVFSEGAVSKINLGQDGKFKGDTPDDDQTPGNEDELDWNNDGYKFQSGEFKGDRPDADQTPDYEDEYDYDFYEYSDPKTIDHRFTSLENYNVGIEIPKHWEVWAFIDKSEFPARTWYHAWYNTWMNWVDLAIIHDIGKRIDLQDYSQVTQYYEEYERQWCKDTQENPVFLDEPDESGWMTCLDMEDFKFKKITIDGIPSYQASFTMKEKFAFDEDDIEYDTWQIWSNLIPYDDDLIVVDGETLFQNVGQQRTIILDSLNSFKILDHNKPVFLETNAPSVEPSKVDRPLSPTQTKTVDKPDTDIIISSSDGECCDNPISPTRLSVGIGSVVRLYNDDTVSHTILSGHPNRGADGIINTVTLEPGQMFSIKLNTARTIEYFCEQHPWEKGIIKINNYNKPINESLIPLTIPEDVNPKTTEPLMPENIVETITIPKNIVETPATAPIEVSGSVSLKLDHREMQLKRSESIQLIVSGDVEDYTRGARILFTITDPKGETTEQKVIATKDGKYENYLWFDKSTIYGEYKITTQFRGEESKTLTFNLLPPYLETKFVEKKIIHKAPVPDWLKENVRWWADGAIGDDSFKQGISYMIKENIISIDDLPKSTGVTDDKIPDWVKNNAKWWADGIIGEDDFINGLKYMVEKGIIGVN